MKKFSAHTFSALFIAAAIAIGISGCTEDYFEFDRLQDDFITWEPDLAFPLVNSDISVDEILGQVDTTNIYNYDSDDFITAIYRRRIFSQTINDVFQIPASAPLIDAIQLSGTEVSSFNSNGWVETNSGNTHTLGILGTPGSLLNIIRFQQGFLQISVSGDFDHGGSLVVTFPELSLNGVILSETIPLSSQGGQISGSVSVDLANYQMDLNNNGPNSVPVNYTFTLTNDGGVQPTTSNQLNIVNNFANTRLRYADGYFGQFDLGIDPNDVDVDLFSGDNEGTISFYDPKLRIRIKNSFGMSFQATINQLTATGDPGVTDVDYSSVVPGGVFSIPAAQSPGDTVLLQYEFNKDNSNVKPVINDNYDSFIYDLDAEANPNGNTGQTNFASLNSAIEVVADVELPFWGKSDHFTVKDTIDSPIGEAESFRDNIKQALLRVNALNGLPADAKIKLYLADSLYNVTDSLLANGEFVAESGTIAADPNTPSGEGFNVITPKNTNNDIELDSTRVDKLFSAKYLIYHADITSSNNAVPNIRIYATDLLKVNIGIRIKLKASPTDLDDL